MNIYPLVRLVLSASFFILSLLILINPEPLAAISHYAVEGRHLLIAGTGTLLYLGDELFNRLLSGTSTPCHCPC